MIGYRQNLLKFRKRFDVSPSTASSQGCGFFAMTRLERNGGIKIQVFQPITNGCRGFHPYRKIKVVHQSPKGIESFGLSECSEKSNRQKSQARRAGGQFGVNCLGYRKALSQGCAETCDCSTVDGVKPPVVVEDFGDFTVSVQWSRSS